MTAIMLTRTDSSRNMARYYKLDVQPTLFGEWTFLREWGRIGRAGTVRLETHSTRGTADRAMASIWTEKLQTWLPVDRTIVFAILRFQVVEQYSWLCFFLLRRRFPSLFI